MIAGHESPTEGAVLIDGENVVGLPPVRRGTAMMFQSYALFPHLSCVDNVAFNLKVRGIGKARAARARAGDAGARAHEGVRRPAAGAALGRPAAAHRVGARADHQPARAAARRAAVGAGRVPAPADARRAEAHPGRMSASRFIHVTHTQMEAIALADMVVVMDQGQIEQAALGARGLRPAADRLRRALHGRTECVVRYGRESRRRHGHDQERREADRVSPHRPRRLRSGSNFEASVRRDHIRLSRAMRRRAMRPESMR